ncbi:MAG: DHH family phosphoesterase, partial [Nitrospirota bacterium]|nr:DHH family phosphoesterase [Nitrospirota bacterium]
MKKKGKPIQGDDSSPCLIEESDKDMAGEDLGIGKVAAAISKAQTILVVAHRNPDGDTLGSMLGLGRGLEKLGKTVVFACPDPPPEKLRFMPGIDRVVHQIEGHADVALAVDCGEAALLGSLKESFLAMPVTVQVDHHELGTPFTTLRYIDLSAAAVGEMVFRLLRELDVAVDRDIATCLMVSLMEDTGGFRYPNVKPSTMVVAGELLKAGADFPGLIEQLYWTRSAGDVRLAGRVVENVRFAGDGV